MDTGVRMNQMEQECVMCYLESKSSDKEFFAWME